MQMNKKTHTVIVGTGKLTNESSIVSQDDDCFYSETCAHTDTKKGSVMGGFLVQRVKSVVCRVLITEHMLNLPQQAKYVDHPTDTRLPICKQPAVHYLNRDHYTTC